MNRVKHNVTTSIYNTTKSVVHCKRLFCYWLIKSLSHGHFGLMGQCFWDFLLCKHFLLLGILLFDKWKQIAWCTDVNDRELWCVKVCWKTTEREPQVFCGWLRPDWSQHKVLVEEKEKRRTGFRQSAVKLGEMTMVALFLVGDMGERLGALSDSPETVCSAFLKRQQAEYVTSSQGLTWLSMSHSEKQTTNSTF